MPLRVALVCPYSLSRPGGVQGQVLGLARALRRGGHRCSVFAPVDSATDASGGPEGSMLGDAPGRTSGNGASPVGSPGVEVVATGRSVSLPANGSMAPVTLSVGAVARALRVLRGGGFDVVHVHEPFAPGLPYGLLVARGLPPMVATFHRSGDSPLYRLLRPVTSRLARRLAVRCAVSEAARSTAREALGGSYQLCFNGVEMDAFDGVEPWPTDGPTVLFLGRHEPRKGLAVLLEAFERLRRERPLVTGEDGGATGAEAALRAGPVLWVAGDGPETAPLRRRHPDAADLRWLGVLPEEEKRRRLLGAGVLCAPSLGGESFGMVLLEAMAARTAVVASDIPGYRDAAGGHARLVPPGDVTALSEALARLVTPDRAGARRDPAAGEGRRAGREDEWHEGEAACAWASHWSMDRLAEWYERRYRTLVAGVGG